MALSRFQIKHAASLDPKLNASLPCRCGLVREGVNPAITKKTHSDGGGKSSPCRVPTVQHPGPLSGRGRRDGRYAVGVLWRGGSAGVPKAARDVEHRPAAAVRRRGRTVFSRLQLVFSEPFVEC